MHKMYILKKTFLSFWEYLNSDLDIEYKHPLLKMFPNFVFRITAIVIWISIFVKIVQFLTD